MNPPGVPALQANVIFSETAAVFSDGANLQDVTAQVQWGIFDGNGEPVVVGDSVLAFEFARDANVTKYPVEGGQFAAYNKVRAPFILRLSFTKGGTDSDRINFLNDINTAQDALELFQVITADKGYSDITIDHYDYRRTARNGVQLLMVDVWCEQVREAPALQFSSSADSADSPSPITDAINPEADISSNGGTVQAVTPTPQTATPSISASNNLFGTISGPLHSPPTITAPLISLTSSLGNIVPPSLASPIRSIITFSRSSAIVAGVMRGVVNQPIAYTTSLGATVPVNLVQHILPPGFTVVQ